MHYHLYRRTLEIKGRTVRAWYYWYLDGEKRIRRACGSRGSPCFVKKEAEAFIARLEVETEEKERTAAPTVRLRDIADTMYRPEGNHMKLRVARGEGLDEATMIEARMYLDNVILPNWGDLLPIDIDPAQVEDFLISQDRSNSWRNRVIEVLTEVLRECVRYKVMPSLPVFTRFKRQSVRQSILSSEELARLFPATPEELRKVWSIPDVRDPIEAPLMFGAMFCLMVSTGLRSGEVRAITWEQIDRQRGGLIVDKALNPRTCEVQHLKMGSDDDPRLRVVLIPAFALTVLDWYLAEKPQDDTGFIFTYKGRPIRKEHIGNRFASGLASASIDTENRKLTPHSLRYTYNTRMRRLVPEQTLRMMIGHRDEVMTDYYTRTELEGQLTALQEYRGQAERFWGESSIRKLM